jgi:CheY-like chemotaxis protein
VLAANNGEEAVKLFQQHATEVRLFLTDHDMPVMDGAQAIVEIRKLKAKLPVIVTSGEAPRADATQLLSKPSSLEEVLAAVDRILSPE